MDPGILRRDRRHATSTDRYLPWLTSADAFGLAENMRGTMSMQLGCKEDPMILKNLVLLALAGFVVHGRIDSLPP